jgi:DNA-binding CsgD family transcriptional regulator
MERNNHNMGRLPVYSSPNFTAEETILLRRLANGSTTEQIGRQLRLSPTEVARLLGDLQRKVGVADDKQLAAWARSWQRLI